MNMIKIVMASAIFAATFFAGALLGSIWTARHSEPPANFVNSELRIEPTGPTPASETTHVEDSTIEFHDLPPHAFRLPDSNDLIDVFWTPDGIFRASEVVAKNGEAWLTLVERNGKYRLQSARARVKKLRTVSYPGDEPDAQLSFSVPGAATFAVRPGLGLKPGRVTTLYHRPSDEEIERRNLPIGPMQTGYSRVFSLEENSYRLRVSRGVDTEGNTVGVLVLELGETKQVISANFYEAGFGENIGELVWVGDLDGDNKLDLYFDEYNEKGGLIVGLYLSSAADEGELVKRVAAFSTAGC